MSNPGKTPTEALTSAQLTLAVVPDAYFEAADQKRYQKVLAIYKTPGYTMDLLKDCDMEMRKSFYVPPSTSLAETYKLGPRGQQKLARTGNGVPAFRRRTALGKGAVVTFVGAMPGDGVPECWRSGSARAKVGVTFLVEGGPENAMGRFLKAYPKRGARIACPPSLAEAARALLNVGLRRLDGDVPTPYPLTAVAGEQAMTHNPKADCGLPVAVKWGTPGAPAAVAALAYQLELTLRPLVRTPGAISAWLRDAEDRSPELVTLVGKAKGDHYNSAKVEAQMLRFYNVVPKQLLLLIQRASQPLEARARSFLDDGHSAQGLSLTHGGARKLVERLDEQLKTGNQAYVHVGDDSWVAVRTPKGMVMFSLDCSNFDLTQHRDATGPLHDALREELKRFDPLSAELWYELVRERQVLVQGTCVYRLRHGGASGMPLQSKVNGMLMDVVLQRLLGGAHVWEDRDRLEYDLGVVGESLGLSIRMDDHELVPSVTTLTAALEQVPFLFIGYHFYREGGDTKVFADAPRFLSRLSSPALKWVAKKEDLLLNESMRLGSVVLQLGQPPEVLMPAYTALRGYAEGLVVRAIEQYGDRSDAKLRWAVVEGPHGPATEASLAGLLRALRAGPTRIWATPIRSEAVLELDTLAELALSGDWAALVDEEERRALRYREQLAGLPSGALDTPEGRSTVPRGVRRVVLPPEPTRPSSVANFGRPPPTKVWTPAKPPRPPPREEASGSRRTRRAPGSPTVDSGYDSSEELAWLLEEEDEYQEYSESG